MKYDTGPSVAVSVAGKTAAWNNGKWSGDKDLINHAKTMLAMQTEVEIPSGEKVSLFTENPFTVAAALVDYCPGRLGEVVAPESVKEQLFTTDAVDEIELIFVEDN